MNPLLFTDPAFLFLFAPVVLGVYYRVPAKFRNILLLGASLFLYAWGEGSYVAVLLISIAINYAGGLAIGRATAPSSKRILLSAGVVSNLLLLARFKYLGFLAQNYNVILVHLHLQPVLAPPVHLPV